MSIGVVFFRRYGRRNAGRSDKKAVCILPDFAKRRIGLPAENSKIALKRPEIVWMKARFAAFFVHFFAELTTFFRFLSLLSFKAVKITKSLLFSLSH